MTVLVESIPKLHRLPVSLPRENAVEIEIEAGVLVFRVSKTALLLSLRMSLLRFKEEFVVRVSQLSTTEFTSSEIVKSSELEI